jgi:hypothetical protein
MTHWSLIREITLLDLPSPSSLLTFPLHPTMFGGNWNTQQQQPQQQSTGLFGQPAAQQQPAQTGGFGQPAAGGFGATQAGGMFGGGGFGE